MYRVRAKDMQNDFWTMAVDSVEDYFGKTLLKYLKEAERIQPRQVMFEATKEVLEKSRVMRRDNIRDTEHSFLADLLEKGMKEVLENSNRKRRIKQSMSKCRRELLLYHRTLAALKNEEARPITDRRDMVEKCIEFYTNLFA